MKYMGSKNRIAKDILPIILKDRKEGQYYVEPFIGGGNLMDKVEGNRIGGDFSPYVIQALILIRDNPQSIPDIITEEDYKYHKKNETPLKGFVGFAMSFGGRFFEGYRRDKEGKRDYAKESYKSAISQSPFLQGVELVHCSYSDLIIPPNSIIYCDPPYQGTKKYKTGGFDYELFWEWCRMKYKEGHTVFISEYSAPSDFTCVWSKEICSSLTKDSGSKKGVEKLFTLL